MYCSPISCPLHQNVFLMSDLSLDPPPQSMNTFLIALSMYSLWSPSNNSVTFFSIPVIPICTCTIFEFYIGEDTDDVEAKQTRQYESMHISASPFPGEKLSDTSENSGRFYFYVYAQVSCQYNCQAFPTVLDHLVNNTYGFPFLMIGHIEICLHWPCLGHTHTHWSKKSPWFGNGYVVTLAMGEVESQNGVWRKKPSNLMQ